MFRLAIDFMIRQAVDKSNRGITLIPRRSSRYPEVRLSNTALFEESDTRMAKTTEAIRTTAAKLELHMSFKKTELMSCPPYLIPLSLLEMKAKSR